MQRVNLVMSGVFPDLSSVLKALSGINSVSPFTVSTVDITNEALGWGRGKGEFPRVPLLEDHPGAADSVEPPPKEEAAAPAEPAALPEKSATVSEADNPETGTDQVISDDALRALARPVMALPKGKAVLKALLDGAGVVGISEVPQASRPAFAERLRRALVAA